MTFHKHDWAELPLKSVIQSEIMGDSLSVVPHRDRGNDEERITSWKPLEGTVQNQEWIKD